MKRLLLLAVALIVNCQLSTVNCQKYVGGDISLLPDYESHGALYYDTDGTTRITDLLTYFSDQKLNAMRVRLFVDPSNADDEDQGNGVRQDLDYVLALGKRIKDAGFKFLLDFHYSDTWADPSNQWTPADWASLGDAALYTQIYDYTKAALQTLCDGGATPDFIQIGNEISYGMCWGVEGGSSKKNYYAGKTANRDRFISLLSNASKACREVCPDAKIVIHTERPSNASYTKSFYQNMASVDYDIIGLSYYPIWHNGLPTLSNTLQMLESTFPAKDVWIVEVGYWHAWQPSDANYDLSSTYPISEAGQKAFTEALIDTLNAHPQVKGLFWWMMEANEKGLDWNTQRVTTGWWNASLFDNSTGKVLGAMSVLQNFLDDETSGISQVTGDRSQVTNDEGIFDLQGRRLQTLQRGVNIVGRKKVLVK